MRKLTFWILLCLVAGLLIVPQVVFANTSPAMYAADLAAQINGWDIGLTATISGNTVTVTGSASGQNAERRLEINENVTLDWKADYSGEVNGKAVPPNWSAFPEVHFDSLLYFSGKGTANFCGGTISNSGKYAATISAYIPACKVSSTAKIEATGNDSSAIIAVGHVTVNGGLVQSTGDAFFGINYHCLVRAICVWGDIIIKGGSVITTGRGHDIIDPYDDWWCKQVVAVESCGDVTVEGGIVANLGNYDSPAINAYADWDDFTPLRGGHITVTGGIVLGYVPMRAFDDDIGYITVVTWAALAITKPAGSGLVVAYNLGESCPYALGSSTKAGFARKYSGFSIQDSE
jgi:hypothetical protein